MPLVQTQRIDAELREIIGTSIPVVDRDVRYDGVEPIYCSITSNFEAYIVRLNKSGKYEAANKTVLMRLRPHCVCCETLISIRERDMWGYDYFTVNKSLLVEAGDHVYFVCSSGCREKVELTPNVYI